MPDQKAEIAPALIPETLEAHNGMVLTAFAVAGPCTAAKAIGALECFGWGNMTLIG